ncbi:MAG: hypothetical protein KDA67_08345 [Rhodobacteraceae bacterium]|nr:hypothetical protein [Paracoccaceae bacterium]
MALPLAPIAVMALRYGSVALVAYAATRRIGHSQTRQSTEDALDEVAEGLAAHRPQDRSQINAEARWRRIIRLGTGGPGLEIDAAALGRVKFRKIPG